MNKQVPLTSKLANNQAKELKEAHQKLIIETLGKYPDGLNYEEISIKCGLPPVSVGRRVSELERSMQIHKPGTTSKTSTGRAAYIYKVTTMVDYSRKLTQKELF
jgi:hypothetical protein